MERSHPEPIAERVLIVGWDGADWRIARELIERGEMPNLEKLVHEGVSAELQTLRPTLSPRIWTSIATGVSPKTHGILDFWREMSTEDEEEVPRALADQLEAIGYINAEQPRMRFYESRDRHVPALWNRVESFGLRASTIGWWMTYPAEPLSGGAVSERFFLTRVQLDLERFGSSHVRDELLVYPRERLDSFEELVLRPRDVPQELVERFTGVDRPDDADHAVGASIDQLRMVVAKDETTARISERMLDADANLVATYFHGTDIASHYFWKYRFPAEWNWVHPNRTVPSDELERFRDTINAYYRFLDDKLGIFIEEADESTAVLFCSDHGFTLETHPDVMSVSGVHLKAAPPGILVLWGPGIRRGVELDSAHVYDIAPTVLTLLGIPFAGLEGVVLEDAFVR